MGPYKHWHRGKLLFTIFNYPCSPSTEPVNEDAHRDTTIMVNILTLNILGLLSFSFFILCGLLICEQMCGCWPGCHVEKKFYAIVVILLLLCDVRPWPLYHSWRSGSVGPGNVLREVAPPTKSISVFWWCICSAKNVVDRGNCIWEDMRFDVEHMPYLNSNNI